MRCYSCTGYTKQIELEENLVALQCGKCDGLRIDLNDYRAWNVYSPSAEPTMDIEPALDNAKALICGRCNGLMLKFRIAYQLDNYIDYCPACDDVWLDGGEWALLKGLGIENSLANILSEPWQRKLKQKLFHEMAKLRLRERFEDRDIERIESVVEWIRGHPEREEILRLLRARSNAQREG